MKLLAYTNEKLEDLYKTGVYQIINKISGKVYIGHAARYYPNKPASCGFYRRWSEHIYDLNNSQHPNIHLQRAWIKYGEGAFEFSILEFVEQDKCKEREQFYLDNLSREERYNISPIAGSSLGREVTAETRAKISLAGQGKGAIEFTLIDSNGKVVTETNLKKFARENNINQGALSNVLNGKSLHYMGYTKNLEAHLLYKNSIETRGITKRKIGGFEDWSVRWREEKVQKRKYFNSLKEAIIFRDELEEKGYVFRINVRGWKEKLNAEEKQ